MSAVQNAAIVICKKTPGPSDRQPPVITRGCLYVLPGNAFLRRFGRRPCVDCAERARRLGNFTSSLGRLARRPKYSISTSSLMAHVDFGRLARRPKELVKFATRRRG